MPPLMPAQITDKKNASKVLGAQQGGYILHTRQATHLRYVNKNIPVLFVGVASKGTHRNPWGGGGGGSV